MRRGRYYERAARATRARKWVPLAKAELERLAKAKEALDRPDPGSTLDQTAAYPPGKPNDFKGRSTDPREPYGSVISHTHARAPASARTSTRVHTYHLSSMDQVDHLDQPSNGANLGDPPTPEKGGSGGPEGGSDGPIDHVARLLAAGERAVSSPDALADEAEVCLRAELE